ncbi:MAG TPA: hypothetical protein VEW69_12780 [Alphaproteobacteria bacterium]|nr:hypothetical protein [Alphaproteobacteria bacterium]
MLVDDKERRKASLSGVKMLPLLFAGIVLACADLLLGQAIVRPLENATVTITPAKVTLFAGEMHTFVTTVVGIRDKTVNWAVEEEDGGTITDSGLYTAPLLSKLTSEPTSRR